MDVMQQAEEAKVLGWTWDQWAFACDRLEIKRVTTLAEARDVVRRWKQTNSTLPGEIKLEGVDTALNHEAAADVFMISPPTAFS